MSKCETKAPVTQADIAENVIRFKAFYEVAGHLPSKVTKKQQYVYTFMEETR
ncbi:MAG: hypothetical protein ACI4EX_10935 [Lachnospiraceae bacterium]